MVQLNSLLLAAAVTGPLFAAAFPTNEPFLYEARAVEAPAKDHSRTPAPPTNDKTPSKNAKPEQDSAKGKGDAKSGEVKGKADAKPVGGGKVTLTPNKDTHPKGPKLTKPGPASTRKFHTFESKLPKDTHAIAHDEENAMLIAFDKQMKKLASIPTGLAPKKSTGGPPSKAVAPAKAKEAAAAPPKHKRGTAGTCLPLSAQQAQSLPGWSKMQAAASASWGSGSYNVVTNPTDITGSPANSCVQSDPVVISTNSNPTCQTQQSTSQGTLAGTSGTVTLSQQQGTTYSVQNTVTNTAALAVGETVSVQFGFPDIADVTASETVTGTFTNEQSNAITNSLTNTQTATVAIQATSGQNCILNFDSKTCNQNGSGSVAYIATGFVWFNFNDRTQGHYKWALSIDSTLPNVSDRSSTASFNSVIASVTQSNFQGTCK